MKLLLSLVFISLLFSCENLNLKNTEEKSSLQNLKPNALRRTRDQVEKKGSEFGISTQGYYATQAALKIKNQGGNAMDMAVAASFVISVERPHSTGLAGGGFLIFKNNNSDLKAFDFRERAPKKAFDKMYINKNGIADTNLSQMGNLAVAVPGLVKGLGELHQKYGKLKWHQVLQPAIELAANGFIIYDRLSEAIDSEKEVIVKDKGMREIFFNKDLSPKKTGDLLVQKDLAQTLKRLAEAGYQDFYNGHIAKKIIADQKKRQGLIRQSDLDQYKMIERKPVVSDFKINSKVYKIVSMPPPSSGGIHVIQILKMMSLFNSKTNSNDFLTTSSIHQIASTFQLAFADRAHYLGDPDFVKVPQDELLSDDYLNHRIKQINLNQALTKDQITFGRIKSQSPKESPDTTHFSIIDSDGSAVASTQTINGWFGAGIMAEGTGLIYNNEMDDFSIQPGVSNLFGAIGGSANEIQPFKTPLSSMSPTFVLNDKDQVLMAVGAPGGTRIITCVAQTLLNYFFYNQDLYTSVASVRFHHQWTPDELHIESSDNESSLNLVISRLKSQKHNLKRKEVGCSVMAVSQKFNNNQKSIDAVTDPRDRGEAYAK